MSVREREGRRQNNNTARFRSSNPWRNDWGAIAGVRKRSIRMRCTRTRPCLACSIWPVCARASVRVCVRCLHVCVACMCLTNLSRTSNEIRPTADPQLNSWCRSEVASFVIVFGGKRCHFLTVWFYFKPLFFYQHQLLLHFLHIKLYNVNISLCIMSKYE